MASLSVHCITKINRLVSDGITPKLFMPHLCPKTPSVNLPQCECNCTT